MQAAAGLRRYFPLYEYEERWSRTWDEITRRGYDAALIWGKTGFVYERAMDLIYLANYSSTQEQEPDTRFWQARSFSAVLFAGNGEPELHIDEPRPADDIVATPRVVSHLDVVAGVTAALRDRKIEGRVAFVGSDFLPVKYARQIETALPGMEFVPEDDLMRCVRRLKSERELDCFREGGMIAARGISRLMEALIAGKSEAEAAAEGAHEVISAGGNFHAIPCCHGPYTEDFVTDPLTGYSRAAPKEGDLVRAWIFGPIFQGYWLDPGRTSVCGGKPTAEQKSLIEDAIGIVDGVIDAVRPGAKVREVAAVGERLHAQAGGETGQGGEMWPYFGHGNGGMWEPPLIHTDLCGEDETFEEGMVASSETFLSREGIGCAGFEQNYIVGSDGAEVITPAPMVWW